MPHDYNTQSRVGRKNNNTCSTVCVRCVSLITNRLYFKQNVFSSAVCGKCTCHRVDFAFVESHLNNSNRNPCRPSQLPRHLRPYHHLEYVPLAGVTGVGTIIVMAELEPLVWNSLFSQTHTYSRPVEEENCVPHGMSPHELYAAESRRIFTPLFPECNPFNVRNNRGTFLEVGEKLWLRRVYGVLMAFSLGNRTLAIFCFLLGISHWYNSPLKCVFRGFSWK